MLNTYSSKWIILIAALSMASTLLGCKPSIIQITPPSQSDLRYLPIPQPLTIGIIDRRATDAKTITSGVIKGKLFFDEKELDAVAFIRTYLGKELTSRGYDLRLQSSADLRFSITQFSVYTERENAYSPFVIWAALKGNLQSNAMNKTITALVIKEYLPKFTYGELEKPLFSAALDLLMKETASKIARATHGGKVNDAEINNISNSLFQSPKNIPLDAIYQLAFSENNKSTTTLVEILQNPEEDVRLPAIYGLGVLQAKEYLPTLTARYLDSKQPVEKALLLKSILEMDTPQASAWAIKEMEKLPRDKLSLLRKTAELYGLKNKAP